MEEVIICGGGLGGLTAAAALAQMGIKSIVLEKAQEFAEVGAGIQIAPNAFRVLDKLGVMDSLKEFCVFINDLRLMSAVSGAEITRIPLGEDFLNRFQYPYAVVHRAEFHRVLLNLCESSSHVKLKLNSHVIGYTQTDSSVQAELSNGTTVNGKVLVGADGLRSNVRKIILDDGEPLVSGHTTYRTIIPAEEMPADLKWNSATLWAGPGMHVVHYPLSGSKMFNLVANCEYDAKHSLSGVPVDAEKVQNRFVDMAPRLQDLLALGKNWKQWVLCDREPVNTWVNNRVALLGDAAHPMLQYFAQGACMAIEDADVLAQNLHHFRNELPQGLNAYQKQRHARTARVQKQSRNVGAYLCHAAGDTAAYRDRNLSQRDPERWYDLLEWIYGEKSQELQLCH